MPLRLPGTGKTQPVNAGQIRCYLGHGRLGWLGWLGWLGSKSVLPRPLHLSQILVSFFEPPQSEHVIFTFSELFNVPLATFSLADKVLFCVHEPFPLQLVHLTVTFPVPLQGLHFDAA